MHTHNVKTALGGVDKFTFEPAKPTDRSAFNGEFSGYLRPDGRVGIRNELWIIPTVGCVGQTAKHIANEANRRLKDGFDGVFAFDHPYGCSQLGDDHERTQALLAALVKHPNAGGVLVLGLGCENNHIEAFRACLGAVDESRVKFLSAQDVFDETEAALSLIDELVHVMKADVRTPQPLSKLVVGLKCGGSDGFSGITGNPLVGAFCDGLCMAGGSAILTEVPEMFGAETFLFNRCRDKETFDQAVSMVDKYKRYFIRYGQPIYENPSPGNKKGGITTLEDKSLGCTQKGGTSPVVGVLGYAQPLQEQGLNLAYGPGNDGCAITALAAAGAQIILFTTGRGTPMGAPVPTLKIATNHELAVKKPHWIDFDASCVLTGTPMRSAAESLYSLVLACASGQRAVNEQFGQRTITIFKDGVTL